MQFRPNKLERSVLDTERLSDLSKVTLPILGLKPQQSDPRARFETVTCENGCTQQLLWEASRLSVARRAGRPVPRGPSASPARPGCCRPPRSCCRSPEPAGSTGGPGSCPPLPVREESKLHTQIQPLPPAASDLLAPHTPLLPPQRKRHVPTGSRV